jgi:hypothetical protein
LLGGLDFFELLGFLQLFAQLGEPASVSDLGLLVEHFACVAQARNMNPCLFEILISSRQTMHRLTGFVPLALGCNSSVQVEHVEFCVRMTQQMSDVPESPRVFKMNLVSAESRSPVPAPFAEDPFLRRTEARSRVAGISRS